jgi:hypothetical protein
MCKRVVSVLRERGLDIGPRLRGLSRQIGQGEAAGLCELNPQLAHRPAVISSVGNRRQEPPGTEAASAARGE